MDMVSKLKLMALMVASTYGGRRLSVEFKAPPGAGTVWMVELFAPLMLNVSR